ncbi:interleukin-36 receptor antagonist protein-like isoform X2 [Hemicordylus capensis]|uniref:interleukin-36 receptor antagonist protein-like isoform X2 n=1 Tax=Hemicordylus capensis TaxID=884348 RepID=UPI002302C0F7|nr:interleukin-36 receptor antagonist protein-like isoform X2 [Hemicordylus capensis]
MSRPRKPQSPAFQPWATSQPFGQASGGTLQSENARGNVTDPNMVALFARFFGKGSGGEISINSSEHSGLLPPPVDYSLRDTDQKGLYLHEENLVVAPLQGTNSAHEETISVLPNQDLERKRIPLILGVRGGSQGLSCGKAAEPKLQLEDSSLSSLFGSGEEARRFTFYKSYNGITHTFESAAYPAWLLCSSVEAHQPLALTKAPGEGASITAFHFEPKEPPA